jgi:drug/metabolite transporter (DMT)-like permease
MNHPLVRTAAPPPFESRTDVARGVAIILSSSLLFGAMAVFVRAAAARVPPLQIAFVRFLGSFLILLALGRGRSLRPRSGNWTGVLLRGLFGAAAISLYYRGIARAGAGLATLLHCTYPVSTAVFAVGFLGEWFDRRLALALALCLVGIAFTVGPSAHLEPTVLSGAMSACAASVLAGAAIATARHMRRQETALLVTTHFMAVGTVFTAPALLQALPSLNLPLVVCLVGVVLTSVAGQMLLHEGLGFAPATQASLAAATSVVSAAVFETLFLGERLSPHTLAGAALLSAAVALAVGRRGRGRKSDE